MKITSDSKFNAATATIDWKTVSAIYWEENARSDSVLFPCFYSPRFAGLCFYQDFPSGRYLCLIRAEIEKEASDYFLSSPPCLHNVADPAVYTVGAVLTPFFYTSCYFCFCHHAVFYICCICCRYQLLTSAFCGCGRFVSMENPLSLPTLPTLTDDEDLSSPSGSMDTLQYQREEAKRLATSRFVDVENVRMIWMWHTEQFCVVVRC